MFFDTSVSHVPLTAETVKIKAERCRMIIAESSQGRK